MWQNIDRAVLLVHGVERAPAGDVRLVLRRRVIPFHVAAVLMPGKFHALLRALHNPLLMEKLRVRPHGGLGNLRHEVAENKLPQTATQTVAVVDEITLAAMADAFGLHTFGVHDRIVVDRKSTRLNSS